MSEEKALIKTPEFYLEDWCQSLIEDCRAIIVERSYRSRYEIIEGKWELGKRICEENDNFERRKVYGKHIVEFLSKELKMSESGLWACVQFYKQYPSLSDLPEGKNVSWYMITQKYLGKRDEKKGSVRITYKVAEIEEAFKTWIRTFVQDLIAEDIDAQFNRFKEFLIKHRK